MIEISPSESDLFSVWLGGFSHLLERIEFSEFKFQEFAAFELESCPKLTVFLIPGTCA